ncbi:nucleotidyltransferase family protein [Holdemania massiliensis]|uniref:nucleotidyltransferase family protein n=1 Tax=Holdemania massiliensis TaxID=1468449 RepID=UPI001F056405|nr:nucleotidyltransferase domain-containing protein [Holdemania massiliensis]MCH1942422.1 nucleotidyltransferase domain-containing protein [Holdemania massiliensis]
MWKVFVEKPFKNCERIHPLQQKKVARMLEDFKQDNNIIKVIVFGSSVTVQCHNDSDLDLYVVLDQEKKVIKNYYDFVYDLWTNFSVDTKLLKEIEQKGVIVYERQ